MKQWPWLVVLLCGVGLLSACTFQDFVDTITGWIEGPGGGTPTAGAVTHVRIEFDILGTVLREGVDQPDTPLGTGFYGVTGTYNEQTKVFTSTWDGGDYSNTYMEVWLSADETNVEYFYAKQLRNYSFGAWFEYFEVEGENIPYTETILGERYYEIVGQGTHLVFDDIDYKEWSSTVGSEQDPYYKLKEPHLNNIGSDAQSRFLIQVGGP